MSTWDDWQAYRRALDDAEKVMGEFPGVHARPAVARGGGWGLAVSVRSGSAAVTTGRAAARAWAAGHSPAGEAPRSSPAGP